jgi:MFS family permease
VLGALIIAVFLASLDTTIISTALPTIAGEFNAFESFAWVGTAYIVTSTIATPLLGKLSDVYGRRLIFQTAMVVFLIGSLLCGLAQSMGQLIAFRAVQGLGGGAIQALAFSILGDILPPRERGRYIGYFTIAFAGSAILGPLVGGFIIERWTWPWIFFINVPACMAVMAICQVALRLPFQRRQARLDVVGATLPGRRDQHLDDRPRGRPRRVDRRLDAGLVRGGRRVRRRVHRAGTSRRVTP